MSRRIDQLANLSVARGCGFAFIGLVTTVVGLSGDMKVALSVGGILSLIACLVLALKAMNARHQNYKSTEIWLMLEPGDRPGAAVAQRIIAVARRNALLQFAHRAAWLAVGQLAAALVWRALQLG